MTDAPVPPALPPPAVGEVALPAAAVAAAALGARFALALGPGATDALACASCRACDATGDLCPAGIPFISEMARAAHTGDLDRFVRARGLLCVRCENCSAACPANLDLTGLFAVAQQQARVALAAGIWPAPLTEAALAEGWLGPTFFPSFQRGRDRRGG